MRRRNVAISLAVMGVVAFAFFVPFITGPSAACSPKIDILCIPNQRQSLTRYFLGFGAESSYGVWPQSEFYYFCITDSACSQWFGPPALPH